MDPEIAKIFKASTSVSVSIPQNAQYKFTNLFFISISVTKRKFEQYDEGIGQAKENKIPDSRRQGAGVEAEGGDPRTAFKLPGNAATDAADEARAQ